MSRLHMGSMLQNSVFSVFFANSDSESSEITFGAIKDMHMASELFWVDVESSNGFWEVVVDDIAIDGKPAGLCEKCRAVVDTGTSRLAGPSSFISQLRQALDVKPDCSNIHKLPSLGFVVAGRVLTLPPPDYTDRKGGRACDVSMMNLDIPPPTGPLLLLGIPFLQRYYTAYDVSKRRIGFAVAKHVGEKPQALFTLGGKAEQRSSAPVASFLAVRGKAGEPSS